MLQASINARTIFDRDVLIFDIAGDPSSALHRQLTNRYRAFNGTGKARAFRADVACDAAFAALDERTAINVAVDPTIDVQISRGGDVAGYDHIGPQHRKHAALAGGLAGCRRQAGRARFARRSRFVGIEHAHNLITPHKKPEPDAIVATRAKPYHNSL